MPKREKVKYYDDPVALGCRLRETREAAGLSQRELSFPGCTAAYISRVEKGERTPSKQIAEEFAARLHCSVNWLLWGTDIGMAAQNTVYQLSFEADMPAELGYFEGVVTIMAQDSARLGALFPVIGGYVASKLEEIAADPVLDMVVLLWKQIGGSNEIPMKNGVQLLDFDMRIELQANFGGLGVPPRLTEAVMSVEYFTPVFAYTAALIGKELLDDAISVSREQSDEGRRVLEQTSEAIEVLAQRGGGQ